MIGRVLDHNLRPSFEDGLGDVQFPIDFAEEGSFVSVDLRDLEARHPAPRFGGVVTVLQVLRC